MITTKRVSAACLATIALGLIAILSTARAQEEPQLPKPTEAHKLLQRDVGTWDATMSIWPALNAEPIVSKATETNELLHGGMWLVSRFEGEIFEMPFSGIGTLGYDPVEKKYVGTWVDSMSPHLMTIKGDYDPATETLTAIAEGRDFETGKVEKSTHIARYIDENTRSFEIHNTSKAEKPWKVLEIKYKRRAE